MTSSIFSSVRPVLIALFVILSPNSVPAQEVSVPAKEQNPPPAAPLTERVVKEIEPVSTATEGQIVKEAEPEATAPVPGSVNIPSQGNSASDAQNEKTAEKADQDRTYTIKEGDTLWDISNTFLKDPFLWPFIWKANPYIANADLIYPGNILIIPNLGAVERAIQTPDEPEEQLVENSDEEPAAPVQQAKAEPGPQTVQPPKLVIPEAAPVPVVDKHSMLNAGFVSEEESKDRIVGAKEEKTILGYDDIVYVSIKSKEASLGDRFIIYTPLNNVRHPVTGRNFGRLTKILGVLELTEKGLRDTYVARITRSFDYADKGSMLTPYQEPALVYDSKERKSKDVSGYILEVLDGRTINAQIDIVYLDKGNADGVEPGDRFMVYPGRNKKENFARHTIGEARVFLVKEHSATAIITKSTEPMARGDAVEYKK